MIHRRAEFTKDTKRQAPLNSQQCAIDSCGAKGRGNAAGVIVCGAHYQRWVKYSSFDLPPRPVPPSQDGKCTVLGCSNRVQSRNSPYCATHFFRLKRGSSDGLEPRRATCLNCSKPLKRNQSKFCSMKCCTRTWNSTPMQKFCKVCQTAFETRGKWEVCSDECAAIHQHRFKNDPRTIELRKKSSAKRRATQRGVQFEDFYFSEIFARDRWICKICDTPVDRSKTFPHHLSPSIDHIVPLCEGGPHRRFNVQCAHWICNIRKSRLPMAKREPPVCA